MKNSFAKLLASLLLGLTLITTARADIWYTFSHGHGYQQSTVMTEYDESWDFDYARGYLAPIVGWSSTTFSYGYLLTVTVDTDYATGYYYNLAYQFGGSSAIHVAIY